MSSISVETRTRILGAGLVNSSRVGVKTEKVNIPLTQNCQELN